MAGHVQPGGAAAPRAQGRSALQIGNASLALLLNLIFLVSMEGSWDTTGRGLVLLSCGSWALWLAWCAVRRRVTRNTALVQVAIIQASYLASGLTATAIDVRFVAAAAAVTVPLLLTMWVSTRLVVLGIFSAVVSETLIIVTGELPLRSELLVAACLAAIVVVPVAFVLVLIRQLNTATEIARRAALTDPLTGLLNRRGLEAGLRTSGSARRDGAALMVAMMIDIDHFKCVNDRFGHSTGDRVLQTVSDVLARATRAGDLLARMGGEEIAWLTVSDCADDVVARADRVRRAVHEVTAQQAPAVTVSIGVASMPLGLLDGEVPGALDDLLAAADTALYTAKTGGRDRVAT